MLGKKLESELTPKKKTKESSFGSLYDSLKNSKLNYNNWFVNDYSESGEFPVAYSKARKSGEKEFSWNGKRYSTKYNGTPSEQLEQTGITDNQLQGSSVTRERLRDNLVPFGYGKPFERIIDSVIKNKQTESSVDGHPESTFDKKKSKALFPDRENIFNMYLGFPAEKNHSLKISNYNPSVSEDKNAEYYSFKGIGNVESFESYDDIKRKIEAGGDHYFNENPLGNFKIDNGEDEKGKYISFYDKWDLNPLKLKNPLTGKEITTDIGKPLEFYDRIYYKNEDENDNYSYEEDSKYKEKFDSLTEKRNFMKEELKSHYRGKKNTMNKEQLNEYNNSFSKLSSELNEMIQRKRKKRKFKVIK